MGLSCSCGEWNEESWWYLEAYQRLDIVLTLAQITCLSCWQNIKK